MDDKSFFYMLEKKVNDEGLTDRARRTTQEMLKSENRDFVLTWFPEIHKMVSDYDGNLNEIGIRSTMKTDGDEIHLNLPWADGGSIDVTYSVNEKTSGLLVHNTWRERTNLLAKPEKREINRSEYALEKEVQSLQDLINDFTEAAASKGGF